MLARYSSEFPCLSRSLVDFIPVMDRALGAGTDEPGLHVTLQVVPRRQPVHRRRNAVGRGGPPRCPQLSVAAANSPAVGAALARGAGIGTDNSPQENQVIAELVAPGTGRRPDQFPKWGSLLLGPASARRAGEPEMSRSLQGLTAPLIKSLIFIVVTVLATSLLLATITNQAGGGQQARPTTRCSPT